MRADYHGSADAVWDIGLQEQEATYVVTEGNLRALVERVGAAETVDTALERLPEGVDRWRCRPISELVGPIEESCVQHAAQAGKKVRVEIHGFEQTVPLRIGTVLTNLVHLTRNAIDHGIEAPDERGEKDPAGTLTLRAHQLPDALEIEVLDDGRGVDVERLVERAIARGLVAPDRALTSCCYGVGRVLTAHRCDRAASGRRPVRLRDGPGSSPAPRR